MNERNLNKFTNVSFAEELSYQIKETGAKLVITDSVNISTTLNALTYLSNNVVSPPNKYNLPNNEFSAITFILISRYDLQIFIFSKPFLHFPALHSLTTKLSFPHFGGTEL